MMFCSQCGKKLPDESRFCFHCGAAVVVPEATDAETVSVPVAKAEPAPRKRTDLKKPAAPIAEPEQEPEQVSRRSYRPLDLSSDWRAPDPEPTVEDVYEEPATDRPNGTVKRETAPTRTAPPRPTRTRSLFDEEDEAEKKPATRSDEPQTYRTHIADDPSLPRVSGKREKQEERSTRTTRPVPAGRAAVRDEDEYDEYDRYDEEDDTDSASYTGEADEYDAYDGDDDFEDRESGSFFVRHARGLIALLLMVAVLLIAAIWLLSPSGQVVLARANVAWSASAYEQAATEAYNAGSYPAAGSYYEKALTKASASQSYDLAYRAAVCYYTGSDTEKATEMARKAIILDPDREDAYVLLRQMYPDANTRPLEITSLLEDGYRRTGSSAILGR